MKLTFVSTRGRQSPNISQRSSSVGSDMNVSATFSLFNPGDWWETSSPEEVADLFNSFFIAQAHKQQMVLFPIFVKLDKKKKSIYFHIIWRVGGGGVVGDFSFVRLRKVALIKACCLPESGAFTAPQRCQSRCQPWWPCPFQKASSQEGLLWPFADATPSSRLMNWLSGRCQCVCALGEGVLVTGGNPSYGILPVATIVTVLQGTWGAAGPRSSPDPHTAVTPLETQ